MEDLTPVDNATPDAVAVPSPAPETTAPEEAAPVEKVEASAPSEEAEKQPTEAEKRIRQLVAKRHEAEREAAYWKGKAEVTAPQTPTQPVQDMEPRSESFTTYEDFIDARAAWRTRQEFKTLTSQEYSRRESEEQSRRESERKRTFSERVEAAKTRHDDFEEVAFNPSVKITKPMLETIEDSELGADLAYYLGKNPTEAERISKLSSPLAVAREIGKLESKISTKPPASEPKRISGASEPVSTITGKGASVVNEDTMSTDDWIRMRNEQSRKRRA